MEKFERQKGTVTLETCIILPIFIFVFLGIYGFFSVISAQNTMTNVFVQSTKSLSLDSYLLENIDSAYEDGTDFWGGLSDLVLDLVRLDTDPYFAATSDWYKNDDASVAKLRFIGYLANGDEDLADEILKGIGIVDGLDGVTFTVLVEDEVLTITMKYEIQYVFDFFDSGKIAMEKTLKTRMWM